MRGLWGECHLSFSLNTACYYSFFCLDVSLTQVHTLTFVVYHVILSQSQPCHPVTSPTILTREPQNVPSTKELRQHPHYGSARVAVALMRSVTPPAHFTLLCQRALLLSQFWGSLPDFVQLKMCVQTQKLKKKIWAMSISGAKSVTIIQTCKGSTQNWGLVLNPLRII